MKKWLGSLCFLGSVLQTLIQFTTESASEFQLKGDYLLGGLFDLHHASRPLQHDRPEFTNCTSEPFLLSSYRRFQLMRFAVEEINNSTSLLPNVSLGYEIFDHCSDTQNFPGIFKLISVNGLIQPWGDQYSNVSRLIAVVGAYTSTETRTFAPLFMMNNIPVISYGAQSSIFSRKEFFPSFLRTVRPNKDIIQVIVNILQYFEWRWVAFLNTDDDYGNDGRQVFIKMIKDTEICLGYTKGLTNFTDYTPVFDQIKELDIPIIIVFAPEWTVEALILSAIKQNISKKVWIANDAWSLNKKLPKKDGIRSIGTVLGVAEPRLTIPGFNDFINASRSQENGDKQMFCNQVYNGTGVSAKDVINADPSFSFSAYSAVYAIAHALHRVLQCGSESCNSNARVRPHEVLAELKKSNFTLLNQSIGFDENGDLQYGEYLIVYWNHRGEAERVGFYKFQPSSRLDINKSKIQWHTEEEIPISVCSSECPEGYKRKYEGVHQCCFACEKCPKGTFVNSTVDPYACQQCDKETEWSAEGSTSCSLREVEYVPFTDTGAILVMVGALVFVALTLAMSVLFAINYNTPVVRSAGGPMCFLILGCLRSVLHVLTQRSVPASEFHLDGDYILGGLFDIHFVPGPTYYDKPEVIACSSQPFSFPSYRRFQLMRFAVEEINNSTALLPNVLLGYEIFDHCSVAQSFPDIFNLISVNDLIQHWGEPQMQQTWTSKVPKVIAVVGPFTSTQTLTVAPFFMVNLIPMVNYGGCSSVFSNKAKYPSLLRTVHPSNTMIEVIVNILLNFNWRWVAFLNSDSDYGIDGLELFRKRIKDTDICLAYTKGLAANTDNTEVLKQIEAQQIGTVIVFTADFLAEALIKSAIRLNIRNKVWIGNESWSLNKRLPKEKGIQNIGTVLGVAEPVVTIPGFKHFIHASKLQEHHADEEHGCCNQVCNCSGLSPEDITAANPSYTFPVYSAVYAIAHALHRVLECGSDKCNSNITVYPHMVLEELKRSNFKLLNQSIKFNENGDPNFGSYSVVFWNHSGDVEEVGNCTFYPSVNFFINDSKIQWYTKGEVPPSWCSPDCPVGYAKRQNGIHKCCFTCEICPTGSYVNITDEPYTCLQCNKETEWSAEGSTSCSLRELEYVPFTDTGAILVMVGALLFVALTLAMCVLFAINYNTPVVRSAGGPMCFLILGCLSLSSLSVFFYFDKPTVPFCILRFLPFLLFYTVCLACFGVRSFQIVCIFKMAASFPRLHRRWMKYQGQWLTIAGITVIQAVLLIFRYSFDPPKPYNETVWLILHALAQDLLPASEFQLEGDYLIGGLFDIHLASDSLYHDKPEVTDCSRKRLILSSYRRLQLMRFTVEEINNSTTLLPNISLGYEIHDHCSDTQTFPGSLSFISVNDLIQPWGEPQKQQRQTADMSKVMAVVGPFSSTHTLTVAPFFMFDHLSMVNYGGSSSVFSKKSIFPSLLRTVHPNNDIIEVIVNILLHFNWHWVAFLNSDNDFGIDGLELFIKRIKNTEICLAYTKGLSANTDNFAVLRQIEEQSIPIIIVFASEQNAEALIKSAIQMNIRNKVWIGGDEWSLSESLPKVKGIRNTGTVLGVAEAVVAIPGFNDFISASINMSHFKNATQQRISCNQACNCSNVSPDDVIAANPSFSFPVYSAVYAIAHALHRVLQCGSDRCNGNITVYKHMVLAELKKSNFVLLNHNITFDQNGDRKFGSQSIVYWNDRGDTELVGHCEIHPAINFFINETKIQWYMKGEQAHIRDNVAQKHVYIKCLTRIWDTVTSYSSINTINHLVMACLTLPPWAGTVALPPALTDVPCDVGVEDVSSRSNSWTKFRAAALASDRLYRLYSSLAHDARYS
ncbi:uncharacterized protein V6R79_003813 [Siganus canaliculatus]